MKRPSQICETIVVWGPTYILFKSSNGEKINKEKKKIFKNSNGPPKSQYWLKILTYRSKNS